MKILFVGDASAAHYYLAEGLRSIGHEAIVVTHSNKWRNHPGHIIIERGEGVLGALLYLVKWIVVLPRLTKYDVIVFNGMFFVFFKPWLKKIIYRYLKNHNGKMIYTALGIDHYYVKCHMKDRPLKYSDYYIGEKRRDDAPAVINSWQWFEKDVVALNKEMVDSADAIIAPVHDSWTSMKLYFPDKTYFVPLCIDSKMIISEVKDNNNGKLRFLMGVQKEREIEKGTDIMHSALCRLLMKYPERIIIDEVSNVPYDEYMQIMENADVLLDQLYQYGYGMNAVLAMSKGIVVAGGGEEEMFEKMYCEEKLRPFINLPCDEDGVFKTLENIVHHPELIPDLKRQSLAMVKKWHDNKVVAKMFLDVCLK